jgi:beta-lactamase superfamily II metal-dependent hydrolase
MKNKLTVFIIFILLLLNSLVWGYYFLLNSNLSKTFLHKDILDNKKLSILFFEADNFKTKSFDLCNTAILRTPCKRIVLIDPNYRTLNEIFNYLKENKINAIDKIIITGSSYGHVSGILAILNKFPVSEIIDFKWENACSELYDIYSFLKFHPEIGYRVIKDDSDIYVDPLMTIKALATGINQEYGDVYKNLKIVYRNVSFIILANIDFYELTRLSNNKNDLHCTFLKYPKNFESEKLNFSFIYFSKPSNIIANRLTPYYDLILWDIIRYSDANLYTYSNRVSVTTNGDTYSIDTD